MPQTTEYLDRKTIVPSEMRTAEWNTVSAQIKERAFFMASVAQGDILQQFRDTAKRVARGDIDAGTARAQIHNYLKERGYKPQNGLDGSIKDLRTSRRMQVSIETNAEMAHGWAKRQEDLGSSLYPAWQFYRAQPAKKPRNWKKEWERAFREVNGEGCASDGSWIALITSPIRSALSKLGQPHPPFDYGSHMDVRRVSREEAIRHGIDFDIKALTAQASEHPESLNENVSAPHTATWDDSVRRAVLKEMRGLVVEERTREGVCLVMADVNGTKNMIGTRSAKS